MKRLFRMFIALTVFGAIAVAIHYPGFQGPPVFDSALRIFEKKHVYAHESLGNVLNIFPSRPLPMLSFYVNYLVAGMDAYYFRVVNAVLLGATALILSVLIRLIAGIPELGLVPKTIGESWVPALMALMFLVHPVQGFAVLYIVQRMALMACFFFLASLAVYVATRRGIVSYTIGYSACFILFICALLSKENSVTLPAVMVIAEFTLFRRSFSVSKRTVILGLVVIAVLLSSLMVFERVYGNIGEQGLMRNITRNYEISELSFKEVALSQCRMVFNYASAVIAPFSSHMALVQPMVISRSLWDPPITAAAVAGVALLSAVGVLLIRVRPLTAFGLLFFLLNLVPEAFSVPQNLFFAHRALLPAVGIVLVTTDLVLAGLQWSRERKSLFPSVRAALVGLMVAWLALSVTEARSMADLWRDPVRLWTKALEVFPDRGENVEKFGRVLVLTNLGVAKQRQEKFPEALALHRKGLEIDPRHANTYLFLGQTYVALGRPSEAEPLLEQALKLGGGDPVVFNELGRVALRTDRPEKALELFGKVLEIQPHNAVAHNNMGMVFRKTQEMDKALDHFNKAVEIDPDNSEMRVALGSGLLQKGDSEQAALHLRRAVELDPKSAEAGLNLATALMSLGRRNEAEHWVRNSLSVRWESAEAHNLMGVILAGSGRMDEAVSHFRDALRMNPDDPMARQNLKSALEEVRKPSGNKAP